jgi:hypothetical protein
MDPNVKPNGNAAAKSPKGATNGAEMKNLPPKLRAIDDAERATMRKARESWHLFGILAEFVESAEALAEVRPAVSIFGSARTKPDAPYYKMTVELARMLSDAGFAVISGGGPGIMEAANIGRVEH